MLNMRFRTILPCAAMVLLGACESREGGMPQAAPTPSTEAAVASAPAAARPAAQPLLEQVLAYGEGRNNNLEGFLAMPADAAEPLPGIIVIHDRWGLNDDVKAFARRLATEGYVALAVDLYGGATADTPERAEALMTDLQADADGARNNLRQAYDYLDKYAFAPRIGALGWSTGGGWSLQAALLYPDSLDAMVSYYGALSTNRDELAKLNVPVLGFFAGDDPSIPVRQVQDFRELLMELGKRADVLIVPGVAHGFANPADGNYDERAANETWAQTLAFLQRNLKLSESTTTQ
jgi:carboxymethylenebutenolidase